MKQQDFAKYVPVLNEKPFSLYPAPEVASDFSTEWHTKKFVYVIDSPTHVTIEDTQTGQQYLVPLDLVEFANPGVLRLTRAMKPRNGGFV